MDYRLPVTNLIQTVELEEVVHSSWMTPMQNVPADMLKEAMRSKAERGSFATPYISSDTELCSKTQVDHLVVVSR
jgi:hypothetical protein